MTELRVLDFGIQPVLDSQAVYHGVAEAMRPGDAPVLTLVTPAAPYVCIGLHQDLEGEVDLDYCAQQGLLVIRRHVGGGAVYLDSGQLFFHFIYPRGRGPARVTDIYATYIEPVVRTYRRFGIPAVMRPINDIQVAGRKIGGTGAASIGDATVFVGSFLFDFDAQTMSRCLRVPSEKFRDKLFTSLSEYITSFRRELGAHAPSPATVQTAFLDGAAAALDVALRPGRPSPQELAAIEDWKRRLADPEWTRRAGRRGGADRVKISASTHLGEGRHKAPGGLLRVRLLTHEGRIAEVELFGDFTCLPEAGVARLAEALGGAPLEPEALLRRIESAMAALSLDMPGVRAKDWLAVILDAAGRAA